MLQRRTWRLLFLASMLMTLSVWGLMAFGLGIELIPEPDAPPSASRSGFAMVGELLILVIAAVGPLCAMVCGYLGWIRPVVQYVERQRR